MVQRTGGLFSWRALSGVGLIGSDYYTVDSGLVSGNVQLAGEDRYEGGILRVGCRLTVSGL